MAEGHVSADQRRWDLLRSWTAERGAGPWSILRDACAQLDIGTQPVRRRLAGLGHLELDWTRARWAVPETCLVELEEPAGRLLISGAVPADLPGELDARLRRAGVDAEVLGPFADDGRGPSSFHLECGSQEWPAIARATGLPVMHAFARRLVALLPPADPNIVGVAHAPDHRLQMASLSVESAATEDDEDEGATVTSATAEIHPNGRRTWWVRTTDGQARRLASAEWAPYLLPTASADPFLRYIASQRTLCVSAAAPLPPLHDRAASLCAGRVPRRIHMAPGVAEDRYLAVPAVVADAIMRSLNRGGS
jgi:hypothetical protein